MEHNLKKRYWVFVCPEFYPDGGLNDIALSTDDLQEALNLYESEVDYAISYTVSIFDSNESVRAIIKTRTKHGV